jgi:hypothetical protein
MLGPFFSGTSVQAVDIMSVQPLPFLEQPAKGCGDLPVLIPVRTGSHRTRIPE